MIDDTPIEYIPPPVPIKEYYAYTPALTDAYCYTCHYRHEVIRIPRPSHVVVPPHGYSHAYWYVISCMHHKSYYTSEHTPDETMRMYSRYSRA